MIKRSIVICGVGALGSRHLEGLSKLRDIENYEIHLLDPNKENIKKGLNVFYKMIDEASCTIYSHCNSETLPADIDILILATNSIIRKKIFTEIAESKRVKTAILEKFLFPNLKDYEEVEALINKKNIRVYVNCPRREFNFFQSLKNINGELKELSVVGKNFGLACNAIHYFDLFDFFCNSQYELDNLIINELIDCKREGYIEFNGSVSLSGAGGSKFNAQSTCEDTDTIIKMTFVDKYYEINETKLKYSVFDIKSKKTVNDDYTAPYQSELTNKYIEKIFLNQKLELTNYKSSKRLHLLLLDGFISTFNKKFNVKQNYLNIT